MHHDDADSSKLPPGHQGTDDDTPCPCIEPARRYLSLLAGSDAPHTFQTYHDQNSSAPETGHLHRRIHGHLHDVWPTLMNRQGAGAAASRQTWSVRVLFGLRRTLPYRARCPFCPR